MKLERRIKGAAFTQSFVFYALVLVGVGLLVLLIFIGNAEPQEFAMVIAVAIVAGMYYLFNHRKLRPASYWIKKINENPQDIVWIKPISVKQKLGYVLTVAETPRFELLDNKKNTLKFDVPIAKRGETMQQFKEQLPRAHYGYSKEIEKIFRKRPELFIDELQKNGWYFPVSQYES